MTAADLASQLADVGPLVGSAAVIAFLGWVARYTFQRLDASHELRHTESTVAHDKVASELRARAEKAEARAERYEALYDQLRTMVTDRLHDAILSSAMAVQELTTLISGDRRIPPQEQNRDRSSERSGD